MKKYGLPLVILVAVLLVGKILFTKKPLVPLAVPESQEETAQGPISHKEHPLMTPSKPLAPAEAAAATGSLKQMTQVLVQYSVQEKKLSELIAMLKKGQHQPYLIRDKNKYTGEMIIVRTKSPLPGTRYFHAQYFVDEHDKAFAQHISFELRPSPEAMDQAIQMVQESFPALGTPTNETRDFIQWQLPNGYVVWVKRLDHQDITTNPFNAYTHNDIGTIRVAVELAPEGH